MSKFLIELPENDEIGDLVELMARFARANFRIVSTLETENEHLARGIAGLTGQILTPEPAQSVEMAQLEAISSFAQFVATLEPAPVSTPAPEVYSWDFSAGPDRNAEIEFAQMPNGKLGISDIKLSPEPSAATGKVCEFCGDPIGMKRRICGKKECKAQLQKVYDAAWNGRRAAGLVGQEPGAEVAAAAQEAVEVAVVESPLASEALQPGEKGAMMYTVRNGLMVGEAMTFREMRQDIAAGRLTEGTIIQAHPSERFYVVRAGQLARAGVLPPEVTGEPGRGAVEKPLEA